uniref:Nanos-type domain-containing protein n=1 Tax=Mesocestoides corti TaxID=53468 RepID=A0A5K3EKD4_MESCO
MDSSTPVGSEMGDRARSPLFGNSKNAAFTFGGNGIWRPDTLIPSVGELTPTKFSTTMKTDSIFSSSASKDASSAKDPTFFLVQQILSWQKIISDAIENRVPLDMTLTGQLADFFGRVSNAIRRMNEINQDLCVFCRNNNETYEVYSSHKVKDQAGRVTCPALRKYVCPLCMATGDSAHTVRYCKQNILERTPRDDGSRSAVDSIWSPQLGTVGDKVASTTTGSGSSALLQPLFMGLPTRLTPAPFSN